MPGQAGLQRLAAAAAVVARRRAEPLRFGDEAPVPQPVELADVEEAGELPEQRREQRAAAAALAREEQHLDVARLRGGHAVSLASRFARPARETNEITKGLGALGGA